MLRLLTGISLGGERPRGALPRAPPPPPALPHTTPAAPRPRHAGTFPLVFSLLSDLFEPSQRAAVSAVVQVATGLGLAVGQAIAGFAGEMGGRLLPPPRARCAPADPRRPSRPRAGPSIGWRWPFVIVALPAIGVATLMLLTTEEPTRGVTEAALQERWAAEPGFEYSERITWRKLGRLLRIPTNALVIAQGLPGCLPWGMLLTFLNDYLSQDRGLSVGAATAVVLAVGLGGGVGVVGGGLAGQWLYNRRKWSMPVFIGTATMLGAPPLWYLVNADLRGSLPAAFAAAALAGVMSSVVGPNMRAMMMNVNEPETRGVALALQTMLDDLGKGLGPALVAAIISTVGRTAAFNISTAGWLPCGALLLATSLTLARDEEAMQRRLKRSITRISAASLPALSSGDVEGAAALEAAQRAAKPPPPPAAFGGGAARPSAGDGGGASRSRSNGGLTKL